EFDPRIHYAVNCASSSCPMLSADLFTSSNIEGKLVELERTFWTQGREAREPHRRQLRIEGGPKINPIFGAWYGKDFGDLAARIQPLLAGSAEASAVTSGALADFEYDWRPNLTEEQGSGSTTYNEVLPAEITNGQPVP